MLQTYRFRRKSLLRTVENLQLGVSKRDVVAYFQVLKFKSGTITSFDGRIAVSVKISEEIETDGGFFWIKKIYQVCPKAILISQAAIKK